ncbi:MAG: UDP-3-O-acyl-N-acetylglucosamine deacetylase, partial [Gemmatimonadales bacterium]
DLTARLDGPEVPALDGSAAPFARAIAQSGIVATTGERPPLVPDGTMELTEGDAVYHVGPAERLTLDVTVEWDHPLIGRQQARYAVDAALFERELAPARTFGFADDAEALREQRLARGASPDNAVVLTAQGLLGGTLRWPDEFVRHKALDLLGDLALLGRPLRAAVSAQRPSHRGNVALAHAIDRTATRKELLR